MGRLIDAGLVLDNLSGRLESMKDYDAVKDAINNMPTAYDIDKVVEELEENASRYTKKYATPYGNNGYRDTKAISIHKAIEIVKRGGVDG